MGEEYSHSIKINYGCAPYKWQVTDGAIPEGLSLDVNAAGEEVKLAGTPEKSGTYKFTLTAEDKCGVKISQNFTIKIAANYSLNLNGSFANAVKGGSYSQTLSLTGGSADSFAWTSSGSVPPGMKLAFRQKTNSLEQGFKGWDLYIHCERYGLE